MSSIPASSTQHATSASDADYGHAAWDLLYDMPAWGISLVVHVALLVVMMSFGIVIVVERELDLTTTIEPEEIEQQEFVIATEVTEEIGSKSDLNILGPSMAAAQQTGFDNHREKIEQLDEQIVNPRLQVFETLATPNEAELVEPVDLTGTTEHAGGTQGAIDRIVQEIAASLRERKTLVVWLFDESISLEQRRDAVTQRFEGIYNQLNSLDVDAAGALRTGIIGYGSDIHILQKEPTADVDQLVSVVRSIKSDVTGREMVFNAVDRAVRTFLPDKKKMRANMMLIIVTDERGDDMQGLEEVVRRCSREGVKAYCIGNSAVFGRKKGNVYVKWTADDGEQFDGLLPADQGPETLLSEGLPIPFWTSRAGDLLSMSSGYGPYALSRLCSETGGIYFIADDTPGRKFDEGIMRRYSPDYRPQREYERQLASNRAKAALVQAAAVFERDELDLNGDDVVDERDIPVPGRSFQANNDTVLRQQITEAQKPLATFDYHLQELQNLLEAGENHREKLDTDRWRASYDLALGRVLAMRVRAYGYNAMLAEMKSSPRPFQTAGSNQWRLEPSDDVDAGAAVRRVHKKALDYLNRVIDEHPGTPWAFLAQVELSEPLGWKWVEATMQIAENNMADNSNQPVFAPEEEQRRQQERQRQLKKQATRPQI
ncbi:MAG: VWA domain-containing protein [Planctomycetaceae bacterium]